ncbi:hypothetical protein GCM10025869_28630 [Homoserinibacter gongjuensis]|uniref:Uncharacterized protein n=1 Tax=Homoserinibacter gongjuensis TaxID=1162968 RepID=A0ABQ6JYP3_9MICO|nr:hypothetical protein GCM10025869_28630 [Homoserinibacter gongjuensis]
MRPVSSPGVGLGARIGAARAVAGTRDGTADLAGVHAEPPREVAHVAAPQRGIADAGHHRRGRAQGRHPPLDRLEVVSGESAAHHELEHRLAVGHELAHRVVAPVDAQVAGVEPFGGTATKV